MNKLNFKLTKTRITLAILFALFINIFIISFIKETKSNIDNDNMLEQRITDYVSDKYSLSNYIEHIDVSDSTVNITFMKNEMMYNNFSYNDTVQIKVPLDLLRVFSDLSDVNITIDKYTTITNKATIRKYINEKRMYTGNSYIFDIYNCSDQQFNSFCKQAVRDRVIFLCSEYDLKQ